MIGAAALGAGREENKDYGAYIRECIDGLLLERAGPKRCRDVGELISSIASEIQTPTLVIRHTGLQYVTAEMTRDLAARLPNSQYVEVEGGWADNLRDHITDSSQHAAPFDEESRHGRREDRNDERCSCSHDPLYGHRRPHPDDATARR